MRYADVVSAPVNRYCPTNTKLPGCSPLPMKLEDHVMGSSWELACLVWSLVSTIDWPRVRWMGPGGLHGEVVEARESPMRGKRVRLSEA